MPDRHEDCLATARLGCYANVYVPCETSVIATLGQHDASLRIAWNCRSFTLSAPPCILDHIISTIAGSCTIARPSRTIPSWSDAGTTCGCGYKARTNSEYRRCNQASPAATRVATDIAKHPS